MEWVPETSAEVEREAWPVAFSVPLPMEVVPSKKITVPVGVPPVPLTVAVNVIDCPAVDGFSEDSSDVLVGVPVTCCASAADRLLAKLASPEYTAVME
jgi:hypothetical protein